MPVSTVPSGSTHGKKIVEINDLHCVTWNIYWKMVETWHI